MTRYEVIGVGGIGEVRRGDDIGRLVVEAAERQSTPVRAGDLLVIGQKIVSKAEGRLVRLADVEPSPIALAMASGLAKDPRLVEVILRESRRVVRMDKGVLITETHHGWICANAGIDQSNVDADSVALLPEDSDRSARAVRDRVRAAPQLSRRARSRRPSAAGDDPGARRRARRRGGAGHGQARPRPGRDRARARAQAERGRLETAPARAGA